MHRSTGQRQLKSRCLQIESLETRRLLALNPSGDEQEFLQRVNAFRADPQGEFSRLFSRVSPLTARDGDVQNAVDFFNVNGATLRNELAALTPTHPVLWNEAVYDYTADHNLAMINANPPDQFHSNTLARRQALMAAGVNLRFASGEKIHSENVFGAAESVDHLFASYIVDWGVGPGGMQTNRGHRTSIINSDFEEIGHKITRFTGGNLGPNVNTQVLVNIEAPPVMIGGAIFEDKDSSQRYDSGEGIRGATIRFEGPSGTYQTTSLTAGGYQVELPEGSYTVTATGGGMRHPVVISNVDVGDTRTWQNLVYDPDAIPPDNLEANNSTGTATELSAGNETLSSLSIHTSSDRDYFKLVSRSTGTGIFRINFNNASGNLDLYVLNSSGAVIASSTTNGNSEEISTPLTRDATYFVMVRGSGSQTNGQYSLRVEPPQPIPPLAATDRSNAINATRTATINVLANDRDPDGPASALGVTLSSGAPSAFELQGKTVHYTAPENYSGVHRTTYTLTDDQGLTDQGQIEVLVINFAADFPWFNVQRKTDINDDGVTSPSDALLIVNELNGRGSRALPTSPSGSTGIQGFLDANSDGFVAPIDALLVINLLNAGSGEGEGQQLGAENDSALAQLSAADYHDELRRRRSHDELRRRRSAEPLRP